MSETSHDSDRPAPIPPAHDELADRLDQLRDVIADNHRFVVVAHQSPDGDAVGSSLAMTLLLDQLGKDVTVYNQDPIPYNFQFLPGADRWHTDLEGMEPFDVTIVLDCAEPSRVGEEFPEHGWGDTIVVVDHHQTWDREFADLYVRDVEAAATGEVIYRLAANYGELSPEVSKNLYCCVMTDTGGFRYSNTSRTAFRIAGELVDQGVEPWEMTSQIYENEPRERLELLSQVLETLSVSSCGRLAFLRIERDMFTDEEVDGELTDGFINYARSIKGVEVATQLRESGDSGDSWRISFRSRGKVNVAALAEKFGGGGHHNAAGCTIDADDPEEIERKLTDALVDLLD